MRSLFFVLILLFTINSYAKAENRQTALENLFHSHIMGCYAQSDMVRIKARIQQPHSESTIGKREDLSQGREKADEYAEQLFEKCISNFVSTYVSLSKEDIFDQEVGNWIIQDNKEMIMLFLNADEVQNNRNIIDFPNLVIGCHQNYMRVLIGWGKDIGLGDKEIKIFIDKEEIADKRWSFDITDGDRFSTYKGNSISYIKKIMSARQLSVQLTTKGTTEVINATFDVRGLKNVVAPLRKSCNW